MIREGAEEMFQPHFSERKPQITNRDFPAGKDIVDKSTLLTEKLLRDPSLLWSLSEVAQQREVLAGDPKKSKVAQEIRGNNRATFNEIASQLDRIDWPSLREVPLTRDSADAILDMLPFAPSQELEERTPLQKVAIQLAKGFITSRFENSPVSDWRSSVRTQHTFLEAAATPEPTISKLRKWFAIETGNYEEVLPVNSAAWRAMFYAGRESDPQHEEILQKQIEMNLAKYMLADVFDMHEEAALHTFSPYVIRVTAAIDVINSKIFQNYWKKDDQINVTSNEHRQAIQKLIAEDDTDITEEDVEHMLERPHTQEIVEVVQGYSRYNDRYEIISQLTPARLQGEAVRKVNISTNKDTREFFDKLYRRTPALINIGSLVEPSMRGRRVFDFIRSDVQKEYDQEPSILPFVIKGIRGYYVTPENTAQTIQQKHEQLDSFFEKQKVENEYIAFQDTAALLLPFSIIESDDSDERAYLVENGNRSDLSLLLNRKIPDTIVEHAFDYYERNAMLRETIPNNFRRGLTFGGDKYNLRDHPDLPGVIDTAVLRKSQKGSSYEITFLPDENLIQDPNTPLALQGNFSIEKGRVVIAPRLDNPDISPDQGWIVESVLLQLIETSLCPEEADAQKEYETAQNEILQTGKNRSVPGCIGHIGLKPDRTPAKFTKQAEINFQKALEEMGVQLPSLTLEYINAYHRIHDHNDKRYLTWYTGRDVQEDDSDPVDRTPPDQLLPDID